MKLFFRITAVFTAALLSAAAWSCDNKGSGEPGTVSETSASYETEAASNTETTASLTSTLSAAAATSTETSSAAETTVTVTETTTAVTTAAPKTTEEPKKGFDTCIDAARAYYNAYLHSDPEAVYNMFCPEEIEGYHAYLDTSKSELLEGKNAQVMFKRSKVIAAINESIKRIHSIMSDKSDVPPENWTTTIDEQLLKPTDENGLNDFNKQLGTSFTSASGCGYVYYSDGNEEHVFLGNSCGFVELNGRWYLSYTTVMNCELITYMDIFR